MDDVDGDLRQPRQGDGPPGGLPFHGGRAGEPVVDGIALALGQVALDQDVDGPAVLGVHHDQPAVLRGAAQGSEYRRVVEHEDAGVGHEQLEGRNALFDQCVHLLENRVVDLANDHVEAVVDMSLALGLGVPLIEALAKRLAVALDREVDDRRSPAPGRGRRPRGEVVRGEGAPEGQFHVGMDVHRAGHHVAAFGLDHLVRVGLQVVADGGDPLPVDEHVGPGQIARRHHRPVLDDGLHGSSSTSS